jgi:predicted RNA binding protein YcfA (HicA-like mRNA interferase family)
MENVTRRLEAGESKWSIAEDLGVPESTLGKRLKTGTVPTSLCRFKAAFSSDEEKELADCCRDLDARLYGLTIRMLKELGFEYAERKGIHHRFNKEKKTAGKDWVITFCERQNLSIRMPEKCSLGRTIGFNEVQEARFFFFYNLRALFEKHKFPPNRIFNMDESGIIIVPNKLSKVIAGKGKRLVDKTVSADREQLLTVLCCFSAAGM